MNKIEISAEDQEQENENENQRLSEINVIETFNINQRIESKSTICNKIFIFFFFTVIIFSLLFFISLKTVDIIYEDRTKENNLDSFIYNNDNRINKEEKEINTIKNLNNSNEHQNETIKMIDDIKNIDIPDKENNTFEENKTNTKDIGKDKINNITNELINKKQNNIAIDKEKELSNEIKSDEKDITKNNKENNTINNNIENNKNNNKKIGLAFVYLTLYSNGIARFITLTANYFMKTGKYDICFITKAPYSKEYKYDSNIKRFIAYDNYTLIKNITMHEHIDIFILQNTCAPSIVKFYKSLGKKVIGMFHGIYMSAMFHGRISSYRSWINFDLLDSYVFIAPDDYFFYKKLGFKNEIYIPNMCTFEPSEIKSSNLTYNNIMMLGRLNDEIKGVKYAIMAMTYIVKEVPDAKLTLVTSDSRIQYIKNLTEKLNLTKNVFINYHTYNISAHFLNSSVHMYTSLSEAFPMAMNEGKAHGLPIVAFDVPFSPPYQDGVIVVDLLDYKALARETISLLKDYNYRKKMGEIAKKSLYKFSNKEIAELWERLFKSLLSGDRNEYRKFQDEIEKKYYNEEIARLHLQKHFNALLRYNKSFSCHTLDNFTNLNYIQNIKECNI